MPRWLCFQAEEAGHVHIHMRQCVRLSHAVKVVKLGLEAGPLGKALTWYCCSDEVAEGHRNSRHSIMGREE